MKFVRDEKDIFNLKSELAKRQMSTDVVAKIENQKSLDNIDSVIQASEAIMVARGDLAVEVNFEELTFWQKKIIHKSRESGRPVITATQMLLSMVDHPRPTRAEISDVANAVYDGTDAMMLSEETTNGKYPVRALETQVKIASFYEKEIEKSKDQTVPLPSTTDSTVSAITQSTVQLLLEHKQNLQKIVVICDNRDLILQLSRYRLSAPIIAVTNDLHLAQRMTLSYGVFPVCVTSDNFASLSMNDFFSLLKEKNRLSLGEKVLFIYNFSQPTQTATQPLVVQEVA